jgi:nucleoside triphosphate pyrophosphatase
MHKSTDIQIVLASASPRRKELMEGVKLDFIVHPSDFEEKNGDLEPEELVIHNSLGKAQDTARHYNNALIIGVDTIGVVGDQIIGKPHDKEHAKELLRLLSNTTHKVISGVTVMNSKTKKTITAVETTLVSMDRLEEDDIEAYVNSGEGEDKAASYAIQGLGALFVKGIEGDYFNVVGLPIFRLRKILKEFGIKRWI